MPDLAALKQHTRIDFDDDDARLAGYLAAASGHIESIGVDVTTTPVPDAVEQAILMLAAYFYETREATEPSGDQLALMGVDRLIAPYRETNL